MKRIAMLAVTLAALTAVAAFAQSGATGTGRSRTVNVTFNVNPRGAQVTVDKAVMNAPATFTLAAGNYNVTISADGYQPLSFVLTVDVSKGNQVLNYNLQPMNFRLTVRVNVREASISLNRQLQKGTIPWTSQMPPGTYALLVQAPGYQDYNETIRLDRDLVVDVVLQPALMRLIVTSAIKGATVTVNGVAKGTLPYQEDLPIGTYNVVVSAVGYLDLPQTVSLDRPVTITADLKPAFATLTLPDKYLEGQVNLIKLYVDGKLLNPQLAVKGILQVPAGKHVVRLASAPSGLAIEGEMVFVAGQTYEMRPTLLFLTPDQVKAEASAGR